MNHDDARTAGIMMWTRLKFWRMASYVINGLMILLGGTVLGFCIWVLTAKDASVRVSINADALMLLTVFSSAVVFISLMGILGAAKSADFIVEDRCNWILFLYQFITIICLGITVFATLIFIVLQQNASALLNGQTTAESQKVEKIITDWIGDPPTTHATEWYDIQDVLKCCGYSTNTGARATGPYCIGSPKYAPNTPPCRNLILQAILDKAKIVAPVAISLVAVELFAIIASLCMCCRKAPTMEEIAAYRGEQVLVG